MIKIINILIMHAIRPSQKSNIFKFDFLIIRKTPDKYNIGKKIVIVRSKVKKKLLVRQ